MKLQPADIVVDINISMDPSSIIRRWALGNPYTHVRMFIGSEHGSPFFYESVGRGVIMTNAHKALGKRVVVMRLEPRWFRLIDKVVREAWEISLDPQAVYDYQCIMRFIIPRLIFEKLGLPLPLKYHRDPFMVCSEAVAEPFWRTGIPVLKKEHVPLPGDFVLFSTILNEVIEGPIEESWF